MSINSMRVLAIDPGYGRCGIAVLERTGSHDTLIDSTCIETATGLDFTDRLRTIVEGVESMLTRHAPHTLALEKLYFKANRTTAMRVAEVRGAILSSAAAAGLDIFEYGPGEVKVAVAGDGRADKKQIARMIHMLVKIDRPIRLDDEYDAIAIGLTHLARSRTYIPALREKI